MHFSANTEVRGGSRGVRKGAWSEEEDLLLRKCIEKYGEGKWRQVPLKAGLNRCRKSCRLRWLNYLHPNIKTGEFTSDEVDLIIRMHKLLGNRWSLIAGRLPGRTANDIKNYCNTHLKIMLSSSRHNNKNKGMNKLSADHQNYDQIIKSAAGKKDHHHHQITKVLKPLPRTITTTINTQTNNKQIILPATNYSSFDHHHVHQFSELNQQTPLWLKSNLLETDHHDQEIKGGSERNLLCVDQGMELLKRNKGGDHGDDHHSNSFEVEGLKDHDYWNDLNLDDNLKNLDDMVSIRG